MTTLSLSPPFHHSPTVLRVFLTLQVNYVFSHDRTCWVAFVVSRVAYTRVVERVAREYRVVYGVGFKKAIRGAPVTITWSPCTVSDIYLSYDSWSFVLSVVNSRFRSTRFELISYEKRFFESIKKKYIHIYIYKVTVDRYRSQLWFLFVHKRDTIARCVSTTCSKVG